MQILHTTKFDNDLQNQLPHLQNYPELLPFIGKEWDVSPHKILLIAESHYIDEGAISSNHENDWYNYNSDNFLWKDYLDSINTRDNVDKADNVKIHGYRSPYLHYYNVKKEIKSNLSDFKETELIFPYLAYYNYFQRPALADGASIINNEKDNEIAYNTFKSLVNIIKPSKIIFTSNRSYDSFLYSINKHDEQALFSIKIHSVPHPGSAWWNRKAAKYGKAIGTNKNRTGRERFIDIITSKI